MSRCFTWFPFGGLGKPNYTIIWLNLQECGVYDIVVFFDFEVFLGGVCFRECYCFVPDELYLTRKISSLPEFLFPSNPPSTLPVT